MQRRFGRTKSTVLLVVICLAWQFLRLSLRRRRNGGEPRPTPSRRSSSEVLKKIDQLVQQNEQLEKQNHELIDQINSLRQLLAPQTSVPSTSSSGESTSSANSAVAPANSANKQTAQPSDQTPRWPKAIMMTRASSQNLRQATARYLENLTQAVALPSAEANTASLISVVIWLFAI